LHIDTIIHCDGACSGNPGPCAWGLHIQRPNGTKESHSGFIGHGTNQVAELTAAIESLARTEPGSHVRLISDSQYVVKGLTEWLPAWKRRGWRTANGSPVANETLWRRLDDLASLRKVRAQWVKGHSGDPGNEAADALATSELRAALRRSGSESRNNGAIDRAA
jgi:ribonuclease HI